jgi:hypothetical protein
MPKSSTEKPDAGLDEDVARLAPHHCEGGLKTGNSRCSGANIRAE